MFYLYCTHSICIVYFVVCIIIYFSCIVNYIICVDYYFNYVSKASLFKKIIVTKKFIDLKLSFILPHLLPICRVLYSPKYHERHQHFYQFFSVFNVSTNTSVRYFKLLNKVWVSVVEYIYFQFSEEKLKFINFRKKSAFFFFAMSPNFHRAVKLLRLETKLIYFRD